MRQRVIIFLLLAIILAVLALTVPRWAPPLLTFIGANSDLIQGAEALLALVTAALSGLSLLATYLASRKPPAPLPKPGAPAAAPPNISPQGAFIGGEVKTNGGAVTGRDNFTFNGPVQIITPPPPASLPPDLLSARTAYLAYVLDRHQFLSLKGMGVSDRVPLQLPLLDLYVPLQARLELPAGDTWRRDLRLAGRALGPDEQAALTGRLSEPQSVLDLLQQHDGLIVLGDPGAGKTTFLKYLALQLAGGQGQAIGLGNRLPILVPLSGFANALSARTVRLDDYIADYFHEVGADWPVRDLLQQALTQGHALVLLDGLDEVKELHLRESVVKQVVEFYTLQHRRGNKFVLSSRIVGYRAVRAAAPDLAECTLVDFTDAEISAFIARWTAALEKQASGDTAVAQGDAARERQALLDAVQRNVSVQRLAANPLLLTILALMQRQGVTLPERRIELYDQYVKTLLSTWNRTRGLGRPPTHDLDVVQTLRILAPLALWMHETSPGVGLVKREEVRRRLETIYRERGEADFEGAARRFEDDVHEHAGLLLERGPGEYGFIHLTFEEYLAAVALALRGQGDCKPIVEYLAPHVGDAAWREVSLLTVGYLGLIQQLDRVAGEVAEGLLVAQTGAPGEAVTLAGAAVLDAWPGGVPPVSKEKTVSALVLTMQDTAVAPPLRRQAGLLLGDLHWQPHDLETFVEAPAGEFLYGDPPKPRRIKQRFWIAKYPVTNLQYRRFMEDKGYSRPQFWSKDGWAWRTGTYKTTATEKVYLDWLAQRPPDLRHQPYFWDDRERSNPILPVVGISWFEAQAYAAWLDQQLPELRLANGERVARPPGYTVRLPSEIEWERAARGRDGREYPWVGDFDFAHANVATEIGEGVGATAVCTYPSGVSPTGAWDMSGNVWEWTRTPFSGQDSSPVVRGGSWNDYPGYARCAVRDRYEPDDFGSDLGVRVVVSLADSDF